MCVCVCREEGGRGEGKEKDWEAKSPFHLDIAIVCSSQAFIHWMHRVCVKLPLSLLGVFPIIEEMLPQHTWEKEVVDLVRLSWS